MSLFLETSAPKNAPMPLMSRGPGYILTSRFLWHQHGWSMQQIYDSTYHHSVQPIGKKMGVQPFLCIFNVPKILKT